MAEKIYIDRKAANNLAYNYESNDYEIVYNEQQGSGRWDAYYVLVIKRNSDGKLFGTTYALGLTEYQEREPFEDFDANKEDKIEFAEYKTKEVVKTEYVPVED